MQASERLPYQVYRCRDCHRPLTRLQIVAKWEEAERTGVPVLGLCRCGGGRVIKPTSVSLWEELTTPAIWRQWWVDSVRPWFRDRWLELWLEGPLSNTATVPAISRSLRPNSLELASP